LGLGLGLGFVTSVNFGAAFDVTNVLITHEELMPFNNSELCVGIWQPNRTISLSHTHKMSSPFKKWPLKSKFRRDFVPNVPHHV